MFDSENSEVSNKFSQVFLEYYVLITVKINPAEYEWKFPFCISFLVLL